MHILYMITYRTVYKAWRSELHSVFSRQNRSAGLNSQKLWWLTCACATLCCDTAFWQVTWLKRQGFSIGEFPNTTWQKTTHVDQRRPHNKCLGWDTRQSIISRRFSVKMLQNLGQLSINQQTKCCHKKDHPHRSKSRATTTVTCITYLHSLLRPFWTLKETWWL